MRFLLLIALVLTRAVGAATPSLEPLRQQLADRDLLRGAYAVQLDDAPAELGRIGAEPVHRVGSISKTFTAVLALQLVEQGRLRLDEPVARWFPKLLDGSRITVEMLLRHRSGMGDVKDAPDFEAWSRLPRRMDELLTLIEGLPRAFPPGERADYNNSGYILLHRIVELAGGAPYDEQLATRITRPLGLGHTRMATQGDGQPSFRREGEVWLPVRATDPSVPVGAGALVSTPQELTRFIRALFGGRLLHPATLARMTQLQDGFGLGLMPLPKHGPWAGQGFGHEGVIDGFRATLVHLPQQRLSAAVLLNAEHWPRDRLLHELLASRLQPNWQAPDLRPQAQDWLLRAVAPRLPAGHHLALRGSQSPLSWQRGLPFEAAADGKLQLLLRWEGVTGLPLQTKLVVEDAQGQVQQWESGDNRAWLVGAEPAGLLRFDVKGGAEQVWREVEAADAALFDAFNRRDAAALAPYFSERLEFFHDQGGLAGRAQTLQQFTRNFGRADVRIRRELLPASLRIYPVPGVGAMQVGEHRFCRRERDEAEQCQAYGFSHVWEKTPAGWALLRVLSYGH
ncbi:serine hydrolase [Inhella sp.]|uniref:serine hydrolase n=1 Tax=Inhella sp. TaxID=1921806 RepID=UPI0035B1FF9F